MVNKKSKRKESVTRDLYDFLIILARKNQLEEFQNILIKDSPALFLYNPDYLYLVPEKIKGMNEKIIVDPSKRLTDSANWFIKTKRAWKITNN